MAGPVTQSPATGNQKMTAIDLHFTDNSSLRGREDKYVVVRVRTSAILQSWRNSLFSFEWLQPDGSLRALDDLPLHERDKRVKVEKALDGGAQAIERPVLGIGLLDNVEIGAGRDVFLTLAARQQAEIEVHIPRSVQKDFKEFLIL